MVIENDTILYFSGTGNSLQVAKDMSNELGKVELCRLTSLLDEDEIKVKSRILGIIFPVYYARLPLIVEELIRKLELSKRYICFCSSNLWWGTC